MISNSVIGGSDGGNSINIGVTAPTQGTRVVNCTLEGVGAGRVGVALGAADASVLLGSTFAARGGAANTTGIALDFSGYAATTRATIHRNDVRAMARGVVCGRGAGNNCTNNPGARDC